MSFNPYRPQRIGNLRDRITLQEPVQVGVTESNEPVIEWQDRGRVHARVEPEKGSERFIAGVSARVSDAMLAVFIRYRPDVSVTWRVVWEREQDQHRILDIRHVSNPDERRRFLQLDCRNVAEEEADIPGGPDFYLEATPVTEAQVGQVYQMEIEVVGGTSPFSFERVDGGSPPNALPDGLYIAQAQARVYSFEGFPTEAGVHEGLTIRCTDDDGLTADLAPFTLTIAPA